MKKLFLTESFCREVAAARRRKGCTQSALANVVGCKQSAVSMFESGQIEKISAETIEKIAEFLGIELPKAESAEEVAPLQVLPTVLKGFCPQFSCPSNIPYEVGGRVLFWPRLANGNRCAFCGELLEKNCPSCGAAVHNGACCPVCGEAYVTSVLPPGEDAARWASVRREEVLSILELTGEKR